jgi:hypothetical protein
MSMRNTCPFVYFIWATVISLNSFINLIISIRICKFEIKLKVWTIILQKRFLSIRFSNTVLSCFIDRFLIWKNRILSRKLIAVEIINILITFSITVCIFRNIFFTLFRCILFKFQLDKQAYICFTCCCSIFAGHCAIRFLVICLNNLLYRIEISACFI